MPPLPRTASLSLQQAKPGETYLIHQISGDNHAALELTVLGLPVGRECRLMRRLPGGGVVVARDNLRIALGPDLAETIAVLPLEPAQ